MDAVLFLKTISRMCSSYDSECDGCPIAIEIKRKGEYLDCYGFIKLYIEEVVEVVEKWDKEHPVKTRKSALVVTNVKMLTGRKRWKNEII